MLTSSNENDLVLIPFAGSGSEIISCIKNTRNFIACEKTPLYVDEIIIPRIEKLKKNPLDNLTIIDELTIDKIIKNKNVTIPINLDIVD
ncbi:MAG: DNA methyltransferase [Sarcina sp.]